MMEVGRACIKLAGREAGRRCVVVDVMSDGFVMVDGEVKRRKCNVSHLEPLEFKLEIGKNAPHEAVVEGLRKAGLYREPHRSEAPSGVVEKGVEAKRERGKGKKAAGESPAVKKKERKQETPPKKGKKAEAAPLS